MQFELQIEHWHRWREGGITGTLGSSLQLVERVDEDVVCHLKPLALLQHEVKVGAAAAVGLREERREVGRPEPHRQAGQLRQGLARRHRQVHQAGPRVGVRHVHHARLREEGRARRAVPARHARRPLQERVVHHGAHGPASSGLGAEELVQRRRPRRLEPREVRLRVASLVVAARVAAVGEGGDVDRAGLRLALAEDEPGHGEGAAHAAVGGEPLAELEERVDVALGRVGKE